jgi:ammonium transporter Rh
LITNPFGAIAIGLFGGALSSIGFIKLSAQLTKVGIYDTCGVNNLHGMPGFFGGVFSAIFLAAYNGGTHNIIGPVSWATTNYLKKGGMQMAGVGIALSIAIITGILTGFILSFIFKI